MWSGCLTQVKLWVADMVYMCPKEPRRHSKFYKEAEFEFWEEWNGLICDDLFGQFSHNLSKTPTSVYGNEQGYDKIRLPIPAEAVMQCLLRRQKKFLNAGKLQLHFSMRMVPNAWYLH